MKKILIYFVLLFIISCASTSKIEGQSKNELPKIKMQEAIREYLLVTGAKANQDKMLNIMSAQMKKTFELMIRENIENSSFQNIENKAIAIQIYERAIGNFVARFEKELKEIIPFSELEEKVYGPVVSEYFSLEELNALISFYKSPLGEKYINLLPTIMQETSLRINELYFAKIQQLSETIAREEMSEIKGEIELLHRH